MWQVQKDKSRLNEAAISIAILSEIEVLILL